MSNRETVMAMVNAGWSTVPDMLQATGWKPHTLRSVLSRSGLPLERKRENGVTSYRVEREEFVPDVAA